MLSPVIRRNAIELVLLGLTLVFIGLAIAGAVSAYSPVPYWDMWNGYLEFYVKASSGDFSVWWAQHNEHRIFLARLLFWIDFVLFRGTGAFLVLMNFVLLGAICAVFVVIWRERSGGGAGLFLAAWLFSWSQESNLTWGFQSQFMLALLLPLLAFYLLHRGVSDVRRSSRYFLMASVCGLLAIGSMANGVIALPLMTLFALLTRSGWRRCGALAVLSVLGILLYFHGYFSPEDHGSLRQAFLAHPTGLLLFAITYVGGPFGYLFSGSAKALLIAQIAGVCLTFAAIGFAWNALRKPKQSTLQLAMLLFILYVGGTALGTAGGRLSFGIEHALSSRYMTPSLAAWAALMVLAVPPMQARARRLADALLLILLVALLPQQLKTLEPKHDGLFERDVAALAIELGIKDQAQITHVFPSAEWALSVAEVPVERNLSIFGMSPLADLRERLGASSGMEELPATACLGHVDEVHEIKEDPGFAQLRGWVSDGTSEAKPGVLTVVDEGMSVVGFLYGGQRRPDVVRVMGARALESGFKGYLRSASLDKPVYILGPNLQCQLKAALVTSPKD
ncbi:hypothetical protein VVD49_07655 [Uliginosibacterium sp. H3]|uniref:Glucosyl transferase GtrII n=1 Tax=Uliginosibacterium silvisoli TaxID=3114758 RepID=A0ABU6K2Z5_9RHOO|nr:hypothetical protein [Uliginosibacterium sp. H3]